MNEDVADHEDSAVASSGKNPAVVYERKERGSRLLAATRALPLGHRQAVTLLLEGLSHREIADVLGTTLLRLECSEAAQARGRP